MQTGFRFRCYPNAQQAQTLLRWVGCQRFIYNAKVQEDRYFRTFARKSLQHTGQYAPQDQQYSHFITEATPWLREVPSQVLRNGAYRWKQAYSRYYKKLAARPRLHKKSGAQSVWLTSELLEFQMRVLESGQVAYRLMLGTRKCPIGEIRYKAQQAHAVPASITLTIEAGRWFVSFSQDDGTPLPSVQETADWLSGFGREELLARTVGLDRGVAVPLMSSSGPAFDLLQVQRERIDKKQAAARRWQRRLARRTKGSRNRTKAARRIAALRQYEKDVRRDFAHQASHALVAEPQTLLLVFEALGVQRMSRRPTATKDETGRWARNGARATAGLSRGILASAWGQVRGYATYKAQRAGKLVIEVPAHHTSQACSRCGHTHPDNRRSQAEFVCQDCGFQCNADLNASENIRQRGVAFILSGQYREKEKKRVMRGRKKTVGADGSECTLGEMRVSRSAGNSPALQSANQETPTSTALGG